MSAKVGRRARLGLEDDLAVRRADSADHQRPAGVEAHELIRRHRLRPRGLDDPAHRPEIQQHVVDGLDGLGVPAMPLQLERAVAGRLGDVVRQQLVRLRRVDLRPGEHPPRPGPLDQRLAGRAGIAQVARRPPADGSRWRTASGRPPPAAPAAPARAGGRAAARARPPAAARTRPSRTSGSIVFGFARSSDDSRPSTTSIGSSDWSGSCWRRQVGLGQRLHRPGPVRLDPGPPGDQVERQHAEQPEHGRRGAPADAATSGCRPRARDVASQSAPYAASTDRLSAVIIVNRAGARWRLMPGTCQSHSYRPYGA